MFSIRSKMAYRGDATTGFQSPAQDHVETKIDLSELLELRCPGRYPVRVRGNALSGRGIYDGDILVADASVDPIAGGVCVAMVNGEVVLATLKKEASGWTLFTSGDMAILIDYDVEIWTMAEALVRLRP